MPFPLFAYIVGVSILGPAVAIALFIGQADGFERNEVIAAVLLTAMAAIATRVPIQLRFHTLVNVSSAVYLAMILSLPLALPGILALVAVALGNIGRKRDRLEITFDHGQAALYVSCSAIFFDALRDQSWLGPNWADLGSTGAVVVAAVGSFLINYAVVSVASALHGGRNPIRVWMRGIENDYQIEMTLAGIGIIGGILALHYPFTLPLLVIPFLLLHQTLSSAVQLKTDTIAALTELVQVVELRDPYTAGHSHRVGELSRSLALRLGLTVEEADIVEIAGRVHDVGKIGISELILTKPGRLNSAEMDQMKLHPVLGEDVIARFHTSGEVAKLVRHHHEWLNGTGYPDGLVGDDIPFGSRILAVADTFDALTSARSYREPMAPSDALVVLLEGAARQWDARVVDAMVAHAKSEGISLPRFQAAPLAAPSGAAPA